MSLPLPLRLPPLLAAAAALCLSLAPARAHAQAAAPGAPPPGLVVLFQTGLPFSRFVPDDGTSDAYSALRATELHLRASQHVLSATSVWLEVGSTGRGSRFRAADAPEIDLKVTWWELGGGANVALRCFGAVCPSVDVGAVMARKRDAVQRETSTGRPLGLIPVRRYEGSALAGVRLAVPRWRNIALVLRHQEGFTNLLPVDVGVRVRSRSQSIGVSLPLTQ
jgi:hypothetical protein